MAIFLFTFYFSKQQTKNSSWPQDAHLKKEFPAEEFLARGEFPVRREQREELLSEEFLENEGLPKKEEPRSVDAKQEKLQSEEPDLKFSEELEKK